MYYVPTSFAKPTPPGIIVAHSAKTIAVTPRRSAGTPDSRGDHESLTPSRAVSKMYLRKFIFSNSFDHTIITIRAVVQLVNNSQVRMPGNRLNGGKARACRVGRWHTGFALAITFRARFALDFSRRDRTQRLYIKVRCGTESDGIPKPL